MNTFVPDQIDHLTESPVANSTDVRSLAGVRPLVNNQKRRRRERLVADVAGVGTPGAVPTHVHVQLVQIDELHVAHVTELPDYMSTLVLGQIRLVRVARVACAAQIRQVVQVGCFVIGQLGSAEECYMANVARVGTARLTAFLIFYIGKEFFCCLCHVAGNDRVAL